ncbi:MAG: hypothetical protein L6R35_002101 [Caloplaca aegaea]|nr:MAG: hypothetical protein L6R35_002101 [Caloplaca aegaea]
MQDPSWRAEIPISQPAIHKPFPPYRLRRVFQDLGAFDHLANPTSAPDPLLFASQDQARSCGSSSGFVGGDFSRDHPSARLQMAGPTTPETSASEPQMLENDHNGHLPSGDQGSDLRATRPRIANECLSERHGRDTEDSSREETSEKKEKKEPWSHEDMLNSKSDSPHLDSCWSTAVHNSLPLALQNRRRYLIIMVAISSIALFVALRFYLLVLLPTSPAEAVPQVGQTPTQDVAPSSYWISGIKRQGTVAFGESDFQIFRNVKDFGAKGDGSTDDTAAINSAISTGDRCGQGCDSSTTTPALVYFPPGTYMVSKPLIQLYYTQFVGDAVSIPTIKAAPSFEGMAVIDADPYTDEGTNWYTNQNNFFRQIRNFVIDLTAMPAGAGAGIHWQVAQATSLQNIRFEMVKGGDDNKQQGIFMDNGSGGFMTDLVFNGGNYGAFLGSQQFTTRNLTFNNVNTAIFMNWNWLWTFKSLSINNCKLGINMANGGNNQTVGSILIQDSTFSNTPKGINTSRTDSTVPATGGTLIIDNVDFTGCTDAVVGAGGNTILAGGSKVASWAQGHAYTTGTDGVTNATCTTGAAPSASSSTIQRSLTTPQKPASLLNSKGAVFERSKPQYQSTPSSSFLSAKAAGAKGDGNTDDTAAIQALFDKAQPNQIVYFDHGAYLITSTVKVPKNIKITGEIWPLIMASGPAFSDPSKPIPVFQVGQPGDNGAVELSDLMFETKGPAPGAILVEWNVRDAPSQQGSSGLWDVHFRIGGSAGTSLQSDTCAKSPNATHSADPKCAGAFLLLHITKQASAYVENCWFWVADHELDRADHGQIDIYNGRGVLIESAEGPVWMYGTSSEHSQLYNYQIANAKTVYMALIQTETPYFQSNPDALQPFSPNPTFSDPDFSHCTTAGCKKAWGLRVVGSRDVHVFGAGLYSFFDNYAQTCLKTESCQENMLALDCGNENVYFWGLSTKAATKMVTVDGEGVVEQGDNRSNFCSTLAVFEAV